MSEIIIIKNNTGASVFIEDMGIAVSGSGQRTVSDIFDFNEICVSEDLKIFVNDSTFIINNGTSDLSISDANEYLDCRKDVGGVGASYLNDLLDVNIGTPGDKFALVYDDTTNKWIDGERNLDSTSEVPPTETDVLWVNPSDSITYNYNNQVSDWVSTSSDMYMFGKEKRADGAYIGIANHDGYYYIHKKGYIVSIFCNIEIGDATKAFEIHANELSIFNFSLTDSKYIDNTQVIQVNKGDFLKLWCSPVGTDIERVMCQLVIKWSYEEL
jgi:hypothetical protein